MRWLRAIGAVALAGMLVGCAGGGGDGAGPAATPASGHVAEPGEPVLVQVEGYEYVDVEGSAARDAKDLLETGLFGAASAHYVRSVAGDVQLRILNAQFTDEYVEVIETFPTVELRQMSDWCVRGALGLSGDVGIDATEIASRYVAYGARDVAGTPAAVACSQHAGRFVSVYGRDLDEVMAFMQAYLTASDG